jgi:hypothetical protein
MSEWICSICLESNTDNCVQLQPCNHKFHANCIVTALRINGTSCPNCRGVDDRAAINNRSNNNNPIVLEIHEDFNDISSIEDFNDISQVFNQDVNNSDLDYIFTLYSNMDNNFIMSQDEETMLINNIDGYNHQVPPNNSTEQVSG